MTDRERVNVKICGITNLEDARFASGALADYLGFIFYEESPRYVEPAKAGAIKNWIEGLECVGVFVNQPLDDVNMIARQTGVELVQLHGNESPEYCGLVEKPVIKALHVDDDTDPDELARRARSYAESARYLLFDTGVEGRWGGTGQSFDWRKLRKVSGDLPFFLAGGLGPGNVGRAVKTVRPHAVDISSGVEAEGRPGVKDYDRIDELMKAMRSQ